MASTHSQEPPTFVAKCSYWQRGGLNTLTNQWLCLCEVLGAADAAHTPCDFAIFTAVFVTA